MKTLNLTLKKKWFDMILSGEKKEEYREIKSYWINRFLKADFTQNSMDSDSFSQDEFHHDVINYENTGWQSRHEMLQHFEHSMVDYDFVKFTNGYGADKPSFIIELDRIIFSDGKVEWGAVKDERYFCLLLGEIVEKINL